MNHEPPADAQEEQAALKVVILFEDLETGARAKSLLDRLKDPMGIDREVELCLWKFDLLRQPGMKRQAARDAVEAPLIVLSSHGRGEWPLEVKDWIAEWRLVELEHPAALVVLLDGPPGLREADHPMLAYLLGIAKDDGVELFYKFCEPPPPVLHSIFQQIRQRAQESSTVLDGILRRSKGPARKTVNR